MADDNSPSGDELADAAADVDLADDSTTEKKKKKKKKKKKADAAAAEDAAETASAVSSQLYMLAHPTEQAFIVAEIESKGHGVVAKRDITIGERLMAERPLVEVPGEWSQYCQGTLELHLVDALVELSPEDSDRFWALSQNEHRFGAVKTAEGIFRTNAIPFRRAQQAHLAVFPVAARFNHACDPNVMYAWNDSLGQLTIHACRPVAVGQEVSAYYGFDGDSVLRKHRQGRLRETFGFDCACAKCSLSGAALSESEKRLAAIGNATSSTLSKTLLPHDWGGLTDLLTTEVEAVLTRLNERLELIELECPDGHYPGLDCFLLAFVRLCDSAATSLTKAYAKWPRSQQVSDNEPVGIVVGRPGGTDNVVVYITPQAVLAKAVAYLRAAQSWACRARDVTRDLEGDDSPAYHVWCAAMSDDSYWQIGTYEGTDTPGRARTFTQLWEEARVV